MSAFKKTWLILNSKQRRLSIIILVFMLISMILETLSIGIMLPLFSILLTGDTETSFFSYFFTFENLAGKNLIYIGLIITFMIFLTKNLFLIFNHWHQSNFLEKIYVEMSDRIYKSYLKRDYIFFLQTNSGQLIRNVRFEISSFIEFINRSMIFFSEFVILFGIGILLLYVDPFGTIIILSLMCASTYIIYASTKKKIDNFGTQRITVEGELNKHIIQGLSSAKDIKLLGREDNLIHQVYKNLCLNSKINLFIKFISGLPKFLFEIILVCTFIILVVSMINVERDMIDIIQYLAIFAVASFRIIPASARIFTSYQQIQFRKPTVNLLSAELNPTENSSYQNISYPQNSQAPIKLKNEINLKNLSFTYPTRKTFSLSEISMTIKKGEYVGIIGETGSGKSTLINLFTGLLLPSAGDIVIDKLSIYSNLNDWQKKIGYVPQSIYLTDDTIRKNIAFGLLEEDIDDDLVNQAINKASLVELIKNLPNGLNTLVGEKGIRLSGGQQQRIGIARALYRDPEILILDEATSSLDFLTEKKIMESVQFLKKKKTLIVVTHRLSTIAKCDKIFFIGGGKILKHGKPEEVLENIAT